MMTDKSMHIHDIFTCLKNAWGKKTTKWLAWSIEALLILWIAKGFINMGAGAPELRSLFFRPVPDAAEYAWVARSFAQDGNPLLPIVNELHPSRYSPIHPFFLSLWIRIHLGNLDAIHSWSFFAVIMGITGLYFLVIQTGWTRIYRVLFAYLILFTPFFVNQTRRFMQEPTIFLLFSWGILAWYNAMSGSVCDILKLRASNKRNIMEFTLLFISGLLLGAASCIRLTIFPLLIFLVFAMVLVKPFQIAWKRIGVFLIGASVVIFVSSIYLYKIAGIPFVSAYHHWMPGVRYFAWRNAFIEPPNYKVGLPTYLLIPQELLGIRKGGFLFGWISPVLLILGGILLLFFLKKNNGIAQKPCFLERLLFFLLFLFALSQILTHLFYNYYDLRFFILTYPLFVVSGLAGWHSVIKKLYYTKIMRKTFVIILSAGILALIAGINNIGHAWEVFGFMRNKIDVPQRAIEEIRIHKRYGELIPSLSCPIFVDRLPVLNARLLMGLYEYPFPIAPLERDPKASGDGHIVQFLWYKVKPPVGYVDRNFLWKGNPYENSLFDQEKGYFHKKLFEALINHYSKIGIYYPSGRKQDLSPFFLDFQQNRYRIIDASIGDQWELIIVQRP